VNVVVRQKNGEIDLGREPLPEMPVELKKLFEEKH